MASYRTEYTVKRMLEDYYAQFDDFSGLAISNLGDNDISVTVPETVILDAFTQFESWSFYIYGFTTGMLPVYPADIEAWWQRFIYRKKRVYDRIALALYTDYGALENYDKHSTIETDSPDVVTETEYADRENTNDMASRTTRSKENAMDSLTMVEGGNIVTDAYKDTITQGGGTDTQTVKEHKITVTDNTHGNVGTTKSQEMAIDEVKMRLQYNLADIIVRDFITEYGFLNN